MARILCVGIATLDIVNEVARYPVEDDEIRVLAQEKRRGGNASNTAVILSQLGHQCAFAGTLVRETDCQTITEDLQYNGINIDACLILDNGKVPTSYITLSQATGSRTICHYRDLPEYSFHHFKTLKLSNFDWLHFEGRNVSETLKMLQYCQRNALEMPVSLEIEKQRDDIESLLPYADVILFSRQYAQSQGYHDAKTFCLEYNKRYPNKIITCAWGEAGAGAITNKHYYWQNALDVKVLDSLGAGDVFNAGMIASLLERNTMTTCLSYACQLAGLKCTVKGLQLKHLPHAETVSQNR